MGYTYISVTYSLGFNSKMILAVLSSRDSNLHVCREVRGIPKPHDKDAVNYRAI